MKKTLGSTILAGLLLTTGAQASDEGKKGASANASAAAEPSPPASTPDDAARAAPGVVVAIDPQTGKLRPPTAEERRALTESARLGLALALRPTVVETLPDGRKRAILGPEFFRWSVVRKNVDGSLRHDCLTAGEIPSAPAGSSAPAPAER